MRIRTLNVIVSPVTFGALIVWMSQTGAGQPIAPHDVWLAIRTDGERGKGTFSDPYDCGTQAKFDAQMASLGPNTEIHLGRGTFRTDCDHKWLVRDGWHVTGAGMKATTIQIVGSLTGRPGVAAMAFQSVFDQNLSGFIVKDLTIDCNWAGLANTAEPGATVRTFTTTAEASNAATIQSANAAFTKLDVGRSISGPGIPPNSWIGAVRTPALIGISSSAVSNVPVNLTVPNGATLKISEKNCKVMAAYVCGANNCSFDHVRAIHGYGSAANGLECFALGFSACPLNDATNNLMTHCVVENWYGNYANPYALAGFRGSASYPGIVTWMTNSRVEFCIAKGKQGIVGYPISGSVTPFTSGGVNLADVKNCIVRDNRFEDCQGAAYQDTGGFDGIEISNNTVVRGFAGIVFSVSKSKFPDVVSRNLRIIRNRLGIQRRYTHGANYGIVVRNDCAPVIDGNIITYDASGPGGDVFWPLQIAGTKGTIINNTIDGAEHVKIGDAGLTNGAPDSRYRLANNRTSRGAAVAGLADTNPR